jgi:hypothetical protein
MISSFVKSYVQPMWEQSSEGKIAIKAAIEGHFKTLKPHPNSRYIVVDDLDDIEPPKKRVRDEAHVFFLQKGMTKTQFHDLKEACHKFWHKEAAKVALPTDKGRGAFDTHKGFKIYKNNKRTYLKELWIWQPMDNQQEALSYSRSSHKVMKWLKYMLAKIGNGKFGVVRQE